MQPKQPKSIIHTVHQPIIQAPPPQLLQASLKPPIPTYGVSDGLPHGLPKNKLWRPSASEYHASEINFKPKKINVNKKKNPFKILEALAEAQAEGHELRPHVIKKVRPTKLHDDESDTSDYVPDFMLVDNNPRYSRDESYSVDDESGLADSSSKADLIYVTAQDKHKKKHGSSYLSSRDYNNPAALKKKTKIQTIEWTAGSSSSAVSDSDNEAEYRHHLNEALRKIKSRKPKRHSERPTLGPSEEHINILQRNRKQNPITNYTKYKNRLNGASSLNTSI